MFLCSTRCRMLTSLSRLCRSLAFRRSRLISFTAASSPVAACRARQTTAKEPAPRCAPRTQFPTRRGSPADEPP